MTLCQDKDSAYDSKTVMAWAEEQGIDILTLLGKSPDFSIIESMAHSVKRSFYARYTALETAILVRFTKVWEEEMDQCKIQEMYNW